MYSLSNDNAVWDVTYQKEVSKFILEKEREWEKWWRKEGEILKGEREKTPRLVLHVTYA